MAPKGKQLEKVGGQQPIREEMIYGLRPVIEAIRGGRSLDRVLLRKGLSGDLTNELITLLKQHQIPLQEVPEAKLHRMTRMNHQGVIGFLSLVSYASLDEVIETVYAKGRDPLIVLLDRVTDVRNFGAIARTAECAGADAMVIPEKGGARISADSIKASAGALLRIPVCRTPNLYKTAVAMLEQGIQLAAATEKGKIPYYRASLTGPLCLVLGSEEDGISPPLLKMSEQHLAIPQYGKIGSLNVSVAGGIIIFEVAKQRKLAE
jgi:23S rRNA (guanosine2251-2'-O)-methyltransferase